MHVGKDQHKDREYFGEIMNFSLVVVDTRGISMVFDNVYHKPRDCIECLERLLELTGSDTLKIAVYTPFGTDTKEERRHVLYFQDSVFGELCDEWNESFLGGSRLLEHVNPLLEIDEEFLPKRLQLWLDGRSSHSCKIV